MGVVRWLWRHKRTVASVTVLAAGAYSAYSLWQRRRSLEEMLLESLLGVGPPGGSRADANRRRGEQRLRQHYELTQGECDVILKRHLGQLRAQLQRELDTGAVRQRMRVEGTELDQSGAWGELKVLGFSRAVCSVYVLVLLAVRLRIHLNIVARHYVAEVSNQPAAAPVM